MTEQRREIGFWTAVSLVIGSMIGSGVFLLPASLAAYGGLSMIGWVVSAAGAVLLALVFAHLARRNPAAGGLYAYTRESFGDFAGFLVAWGYWISAWSANAALAVAFAGYAEPLLAPSLSIAPGPVFEATLAIGAVWFLTAVNSFGVGVAGRVQVATTALKLLPLVFVGIGGLLYFEPAHFAVPVASSTSQGSQVLAVVTLTLFAFLGLEAATVPAGAVRDPDRTIPRATIIGTVVTAAIYIISTAGVMSLVAPDVLAKSTAPFADAARALAGNWVGGLVGFGAAVSAFGALNGWILIVSQLPLAVARDGAFPSPFARVTANGVPVTGMIIAGVLSTALIGMNYIEAIVGAMTGRPGLEGAGLVAVYTKILLLSTLATLIPYAFCSLAVFLPGGRRASGLAVGTALIAGLAFVYAFFAIYGAGADVVNLGFLLILAGLPVYVWVVRQRGAAAKS